MQRPPQAVPTGAGCPPPLAAPQNIYWRNGPFGRRANAQALLAAGPVQPVTDPFAFGRQAPKCSLVSNVPRGNPSAPQGFSPVTFPPPAAVCPPCLRPGDSSHELQPSLPAPISQSGSNGTFSAVVAPVSSVPAHIANNSTEMHPNLEHNGRNPLGQSHPVGITLENSVGGHQGLPSVPDRPLSEQEVSRNPPNPSLPAFTFAQQIGTQWKPAQDNLQPQGQTCSPYPEPPSQNAFYHVTQSASRISQPSPHTVPQQSSPQHSVVQNAMQVPLMFDASAMICTQSSTQNTTWQSTGVANPWPGQFPQEHFYLQPLESSCDAGRPTIQENNPSVQFQDAYEAGSGHYAADVDSGMISMFFKGDEAENEEILSSEKNSEATNVDFETFQQAVGHTYYQPLHAQQILAAAFPQSHNLNISTETVQKGMDVQHSPRVTCQPHDIQGSKNMAYVSEVKAGPPKVQGHVGSQYENVENLEYIQNQEVLPSEAQTQNGSSPGAASDSCRYASLAPLHPNNSIAIHAEGGPNLEAPDSVPPPVRPESSSSSYSNRSHRSLPSSTRPRELGTFIQQESGKPAEDSAAGFFKQVDSSPLEGDSSEQNQGTRFHSSLPQMPTPSPPKPMGVFQTSANSSFEPVRSHGFGVKPLEVDEAKMMVELRENCPNPKNTKKSAAIPVISPGNLEQPPDNLETIFMSPETHPLPLTIAGDAGNGLWPLVGSEMENTQSVPEKKPPSRAQGITKKCESPATTLWAPNELPNFGGNVLLAPAAPAVYVPAKQTVQVVQPPDEGLAGEQPSKPGLVLPTSQSGNTSSENLENPPKTSDFEALPSQASSGYASLLSSPPTEALQNQPVLIAQPNQSCSLTQPVNFCLVNQLSRNENNYLAKDPRISSKPLLAVHSSSNPSGDNAPVFISQTSPVSASNNPNLLKDPPSSSEMTSNKSANFLEQSAFQVPLNLTSEGQQAASFEGVPPEFTNKAGMNPSCSSGNASLASASAAGTTVPPNSNPTRSQNGSKGQEPTRALDFTVAKTLEQGNLASCTQVQTQLLFGGPGKPQPACLARQVEPQVDSQLHFYTQVMQGVQSPAPLQQQIQTATALQVLPSRHSSVPPESSPAQAATNRSCLAGAVEESSAHLSTSHDQVFANNRQATLAQPLSAAATTSLPSALTSIGSSQPTGARSDQDQQHPPPSQTVPGPPANPYYYYRHSYDSYPSQYQQPYPPTNPRTSQMYYQEDAYGQYDRAFWQYDSTDYRDPGSYRYTEPERPSSRASHTSDRPSSRQGYSDDYYNPKGGWSNYYAEYYANPYDYEDPGRWSRYRSAYDARLRDSRSYDQRLWYDSEQNPYPKREAYPYENSHEDHWRYDPRFAGSFEDDLEPRRDPYGDELDRRSIHSEHSGHSLRSSHSRQSSFSSRSQQSQLYRSNHDLTASAYEAAHQPASLHAEYSYGGYSSFDSQAPFADYGYPAKSAWPAAEQVPSRPLTPEKFSVPHVCARFGPGGYLMKVLPNLPSEGQPALVEISSLEVTLQHSSEQEEMRAFPGPLTKDDTHKVDVINFAQNKAMRCCQNEALIDRESARLLWDFIVLLCRQNGTVVGTDIAELLLQDHKTVWLPGKSPNEANLIDFTNEAVEQVEEESGEAQLSFLTDSLIATIDSLEKETERFRELLLYGRKKDALESAMKHGLWGHALLLASKMDSRTHARVMTRFANSLPANDPLQTVYQLMSGRMPAASTCCGDEKWGDWRPHLAMVLSNLTYNMDVELRTITTMGDTLASKGLLDAAHFCYLMAQVGFGIYMKKTAKLVLIGSNHSLPLLKFATNEAIQRTEAYEYAQSLGTSACCLPNFQVFKFIYACRLAEMGLAAQAFHYCEVISKAVLQSPCSYSPVLISQLIQISSQLRLFDPQLKEKPEQELFVEPGWLVQLRNLDGQIREGTVAYNTDRSTPQQYVCNTPSSELDRVGQHEEMGAGQEMTIGSGNTLLASLLPTVAHPMQNIQLMPSAPPNILEGSAALASPSRPEALGAVGLGSPFPNACGAEQIAPSQETAAPPVSPAQINPETVLQGSPHESPVWKAGPDPRDDDFYGKMETMGSGRQSRSASQSSAHMSFGRRSRTTSESSVHSIGQERPNSLAQQPSLPRLPIPEEKRTKKESAPQKRGGTWFDWLMRKGKNEAHLPDDKNKSIVWDEKKQRWVNLDEPEEESKPPPPPPTEFPKVPQAPSSGHGGPPSGPVNIFSRRAAGNRGRYVDVLNPSGAKPAGAVPAPPDLFAPLAPMPIPANVFVPNPALEEQQPLEGQGAEEQMASGNQTAPEIGDERPYLNSAVLPPGSELFSSNTDGSQCGELSRSSSMSSLSREVSQHFNQLPLEGSSAGMVQFYNPAQFAQTAALSGSSRLGGRTGQRKYPVLK
ncbi:protein transport protein Sec16A isoform X1 [Sphaerodactylus townsendi]|uniref:protein transport protein Sec16A isoform X1 n=1 Tax=Sphaerodactylus townsendi TaxID=933632 RepID=UPI00202610BF|nr:protein transport protein Sec16A isoform X1 [Sphaerodactylus townsendi]